MNEDELERLSSQNSYLLSLYQDKDKQLTILKNYLKQSENRDERTDRADHEHRKRPRSLLVDPFINERFASLQNQIEMYKNKLNKALKVRHTYLYIYFYTSPPLFLRPLYFFLHVQRVCVRSQSS